MADGIFTMTILGRTIEHLGTQMYKHRAPAIAELIANCWDAGSKKAWIEVPSTKDYAQHSSVIAIMDDGEGMTEAGVQDHYLVVGRNRRHEDGTEKGGRKIMGRKGIGKLAGFGLAAKVTVTTWVAGTKKAIRFSMSLAQLKCSVGTASDIQFPWEKTKKEKGWPAKGTRIELSDLRHASPLEIGSLCQTLARRFSRTTRGNMKILINGQVLPEPDIPIMYEFPDGDNYEEVEVEPGKTVRYRYAFAQKPIPTKEMQGFVIYATERTAQAPPFFFNVESTASSQHSTRYVTGEIIADYLDAGTDDETDVISTDRQELDWEKEDLASLRAWGERLSRDVLTECAEEKGKEVANWILDDADFSQRVALLGDDVKKEITRFLKILGQKSEREDQRTRDLADSLIRAYEFRTFHDVIDDIRELGDDPEKLEEMLGRLHDWKVLESRAILEIVRGRLSIIDKLEQMIIHNAPETASARTHDNLHDLLAEYPWIFNPEWQVFAEEKTLSKQLREWGKKDCPEDMAKKRIDFLAFTRGTDELIIIELKRPGHAVEYEEIQRLDEYQVQLMRSRPNCRKVLVFGGQKNIPDRKWDVQVAASDFEALKWSEMFARAKRFYAHYEAVLAGDVTADGFESKRAEVARTRTILESGSAHRAKKDRRRGLGSPNA